MRKKLTYLIFSLVIIIFYSIIVNNIELNRMIYDSVAASSVNFNSAYRIYDLDDMERELDNLEDKSVNADKYKDLEVSSIVKSQAVPKERILFNLNPFDLRFETRNYKIYLNYKVMNSVADNISNFSDKMGNKFIETVDEIISVKNSIESFFHD